MEDDYWFRAKEDGYGAGYPLNWKGWALILAILIAMFGGQYLIQHFVPQRDWASAVIAGVIVIGGPFLWLAHRKTEGGWHWRD
jgi:hypothetical protein